MVAPSAGKKALGWITNERPLAQYVNWILFTIYSWLGYLDNGERRVRLPASYGYSDAGYWGLNGYKIDSTSNVGGADWYYPLPVKEGDILTSGSFRILSGIATNEITCSIAIYTDNVLATGYVKESTTPNVVETLVVDENATLVAGALPHTMGPNDYAFLTVGTSGAGTANRSAYWVEYQATIATDKD